MLKTTSKYPDAKPKVALYAITAVIAALFRGAHLYFWSKTPFRIPALDELYHHTWAEYIAGGNLLFPSAFFRAPAYPYFLGGLYALFGPNPWFVRIVQTIIGIIGCVLIAELARIAFKNWKIGLIAGLLAALSPMPALFESRLFLDWMLIPLGAAFLIFTIRTTETKRNTDPFLAGLFAGIFAITRPNILAVFPFIVLWAVLVKRKQNWWKTALLLLLGFIIPIIPVLTHNISRGNTTLIATQGGLNLYLGNNPETDGCTPILPDYGGTWTLREAWRSAEDESGKELSASRLDKFYLSKALDFAKNNPKKEIRLIINKVLFLLSPIEYGNNGSPEFFRKYSPPLYSPFGWGILLVLALMGLPFIRRFRNAGLLILWTILYGATIVLFFVNARFRLPLLVGVIPLAAGGIFYAIDFAKKRKVFTIIWLIIFAAIAGFIYISHIGDLPEHAEAESWFGLGNLYMRSGDLARADSAFEKTLEILPQFPRANLNRGAISYRQKDFESAERYFASEIAANGEAGPAWSNIGVIERLRGDTTGAIYAGKKAISADEYYTPARINLAQTYFEFGKYDSAFIVAQTGLEIDSLDRRLLLIAGASAIKTRELEIAEYYLERVVRPISPQIIRLYELWGTYAVEAAGAAPDSIIRARAFYNLANLEMKRFDFPQARDYLKSSLKLYPSSGEVWADLGTVYERLRQPEKALRAYEKAVASGIETAEIFYNMGLVNAQMGKLDTATGFFEESLKLNPEFTLAKEKIKLIEKLEDSGENFP